MSQRELITEWISGEEPPRRAKKLKRRSPSPSFDMLPDDILLNCFARVSKADYGSLSIVSKLVRSLILSTELYDLRSRMGLTENCIFLCLSTPSYPFVRWFPYYPKPLNPKVRVIPIPPLLNQPPEVFSVVAHGVGIYIIGGRIRGERSSSVFFLDCRTHKWSNLPSMKVARAAAAAGVVDGKIYVFGGCEDPRSCRWGEVFDPKTQIWDALPLPPDEIRSVLPLMYESGVVKEKIWGLLGTGTCLLYTPSEGIWKIGSTETGAHRSGWCMSGNVMYCCVKGGRILWCEDEQLEEDGSEFEWRQVKSIHLYKLTDTLCASKLVHYGGGLYFGKFSQQELPTERLDALLPGHKLSNYGPNMLLFWKDGEEEQIWCAEISFKRCKWSGDIRGNVEWSEPIMRPPPLYLPRQPCKLLHSLTLRL